LEHIDNGNAHFLADGKHITLNASEPGHGIRSYVVDLESGKSIAVTPEGIKGGLVSPDERYIVRADDAGVLSVYFIPGGRSRRIPDLEPGFVPLRWSEDDSAIFGYRPGQLPTKVYKVNLTTGQKTLIQQLQPDSSTGVVSIKPVVVNRDGSRIAYSYYQVLSALYLISGLQ